MTAKPIEVAKVMAMLRTLPPSIDLAPGVIVITSTLKSMTATMVIAHLSSPKLGIGCEGSKPMFESR